MSPRSVSLQCHTAFCMKSSRIGADQSGWCFGTKSFSHLLTLWELLVKRTSMMSWFSLSLRRTKVSLNSTWEGWASMNGTTTWRPASMKISTLLLGNTTWQKTIRGDPANRTQLWKGSKLKGKMWIFPFLLRHQLIIADTNQDLLSLQEAAWSQSNRLVHRRNGCCLLLSQMFLLQLLQLIRLTCVIARRELRPHQYLRDPLSSWGPMDIGTGLGTLEIGCGTRRAIATSRTHTHQISYHQMIRWMIGWVKVGLTGHAALRLQILLGFLFPCTKI